MPAFLPKHTGILALAPCSSLMDGRFKAKLVEGDGYLLKLSRYVHLNPVQVGRWKKRPVSERIAYLRRYRWSSYLEYIQDSGESGFLDKGPVLADMGGRKKERPVRYREFVETGLVEDDLDFQEALKASPLGIGDEAFQQWAWVRHRELALKRGRPEDVTYRRKGVSLEPGEVLKSVAEGLEVNLGRFGSGDATRRCGR